MYRSDLEAAINRATALEQELKEKEQKIKRLQEKTEGDLSKEGAERFTLELLFWTLALLIGGIILIITRN
jgi:hypothetical protein